MKFSVAAILALASMAVAYSPQDRSGFIVVKRQEIQNQVDPSIPAMSNANGDVLPFRTDGVYKDAAAKGI